MNGKYQTPYHYLKRVREISNYRLIFSERFDKVPHQRLLHKLKAHGIGDGIINWIEQWLTYKRQRVVVDGWFQTGNQF